MIEKSLMFNRLHLNSRDEFFSSISDLLEEKKIVQAGFAEALKAREQDYPTGLPVPGGVAIPHTDGALVNADRLVFVTLDSPIQFNEMGGDEDDVIDVKLLILLAIGNGKKHLDVLQKLIIAIQNPDFVTGLIHSETRDQMFEIVEKELSSVVMV
jgi:PTS system galactitol-specific IIA component